MCVYKSGCVATPNSQLCCESGCTSKLTDVLRRVDVRQPHTNQYVTKVRGKSSKCDECVCVQTPNCDCCQAQVAGCVATSQPQMHPANVAVWHLPTDNGALREYLAANYTLTTV